MEAINTFTDKIVSDLDNSLIKNDQWVFPTINIRVFNKDGKGFIASILPGDDLLFEVTRGYVVIGAQQYNGVLYLVCHDESTGKGEIGTYPYPNGTGFTDGYAPLANVYYQGGAYLSFQTTVFNFSLNNPVDIIIKESYDNSVDLYLCDYRNPNRVINSGFNQLGVFTYRNQILDTWFDGALNLIPVTVNDLTASIDIAKGGYLKPGNYWIYIRYLTGDYGTTNFIKEFGPFSILWGSTVKGQTGLQEKDWINDTENVTDKKITLTLTGLDTNYKYYQVAIMRYSSMQENAVATKDVYLIDKYYDVNTSLLTIYGNETEQTITFEEIVAPTNPYVVSRSQNQIEDHYLIANCKKVSVEYDRDDFIEFARSITIGCQHDATLIASYGSETDKYTSAYNIETGNSQIEFYQDPENVNLYLGYFKGQIYPFGIKFLFENGEWSQVFPCKGNYDNGATDPDGKGLFKFNTWLDAIGSGTVSQRYITRVTFDLTLAKTYMAQHPMSFANVVGFRFVRGERIDNLIGQGIVLRGFYGMSLPNYSGSDPYTSDGKYTFCTEKFDDGGDYTSGYDTSEAGIIPLFRGNMPTEFNGDIDGSGTADDVYYGRADENGIDSSWYQGSGNDTVLPSWTTYIGDSSLTKPYYHKHGVFIPDILFESDTFVPETTYLEPLFKFYDTGSGANMDAFLWWNTGEPGHCMRDYVLDMTESVCGTDPDAKITLHSSGGNEIECKEVSSVVIEKNQKKGKMNFTAWINDAGDDDEYGLVVQSKFVTRNIGICKYIGIEDTTTDKWLRNLYGLTYPSLSIVNIYKQANNDSFFQSAYESFEISSTVYNDISDTILLGSISDSYGLYKGDCFLNRTWFRQSRWYDMNKYGNTNGNGGFGSNILDDDSRYYQHGLMIGIMTECKYNTYLRNEVIGQDETDEEYIRYSYFPRCLANGITTREWVQLNAGQYLHEAFQINDGYNKTLSENTTVGYELTEPDREDVAPNRVYASVKHTAGSFIDGYRNIAIDSYRDYCIELGEIMRIMKIDDYPCLVHKYGISQIYLNERAIQNTTEQELTIATSVNFLSERKRTVAEFGTQHGLSVQQGNVGIYGIDYMKRIIWRIAKAQSYGGGFYLQAEDLVTSRLIQAQLKEILDWYSETPNIITQLPDTPYSGIGIVTGYDPEFKEVVFTFLLGFKVIGGVSGFRNDKTLIFDEMMNGFKGTYSFTESRYISFGSMLLSTNHTIALPESPGGSEWTCGNKIYKHNVPLIDEVDNYNTFKGIAATAKLSFIVNGVRDEQTAILSKIMKIFNSLDIECVNENFYRILYETQYQQGVYLFDPSSASFWLLPEYNHHKWHVPITNQTSSEEENYDEDSEMQGNWMKVTIEYKGKKDLEIKNVITDFTPINQ